MNQNQSAKSVTAGQKHANQGCGRVKLLTKNLCPDAVMYANRKDKQRRRSCQVCESLSQQCFKQFTCATLEPAQPKKSKLKLKRVKTLAHCFIIVDNWQREQVIKPRTLCCAVEEKRVQKKGKSYVVLQPNWSHGRIGRRGRRRRKKVAASKKTPEGSRPNGNEPQGWLCFTGCSSACEKTSETRQR